MPAARLLQVQPAEKTRGVLVTIGPEAAAEIMKQLDDTTVESGYPEMTQLGLIPIEHQKRALEEFSR